MKGKPETLRAHSIYLIVNYQFQFILILDKFFLSDRMKKKNGNLLNS